MPELPKCNYIPIYVTCVYWKYHRVFRFHPCGWMIRFTQEKAFRSLGNAHSLSFSEIDLHFSLLNFLVPLEGWGHFSDWFSPEKKGKQYISFLLAISAASNETSLPPSQRVEPKPVRDPEQQLCPSWDNCQPFLVSAPLYTVASSSAFEIYTLITAHI